MYIKEPRTPEQLEALALKLYVTELGDRLHMLETGGAPEPDEPIARAPSPPPEYDREGRRTNTRQIRAVQELEVERTFAVHRALELVPGYAPPANFTRLTRSTNKFFLPVREYPQINFIGLLLGPRGRNLRRMELEAGARISIRGRGSVKEGNRLSSQPNEEDLHCLISSTSQQSIQRARALVQQVVDTAVATPDDMNDYKRSQLRELAQLNGTFRDDEAFAAQQQTHPASQPAGQPASQQANAAAAEPPAVAVKPIARTAQLAKAFDPLIPPGTDHAPERRSARGPPPAWVLV